MEVEQDNNIMMTAETPQPVVEKDKKPTGLIVGMIILAIIALGGVAFGVFGMVGKDQAEKNLAIKITEIDGKVTDIVTDKITSIDKDGTVTEITDTNVTTEAVNPEDYIYIGEWGIKIEIPKNLGNVSYWYGGDKSAGYAGACTWLAISGSTKDGGLNPEWEPDDYLGSVMRCPSDIQFYYGPQIFSDDDYNYYYEGSQYSVTNTEWETNSIKMIQEMLMDSENYSKI